MSIRRYLILILISIITLVSFIAAIQGYKASMLKAADLFDAQLHAVSDTVIALNPSKKNIKVNNQDNLAFQLWYNNVLVSKTSNAPSVAISAFKQGYSDDNFDGKRWRVFTKQNGQLWIMVAQSIKPRFDLAEKVILSAVTPMIIIIPLLSVIIFLVITHGLKPLNQLTAQLKHKKINDLTVISIENASKEIQPVVDTLNRVFTQLDSAYEREKRFASDAAHELRTPLSVLKINAHNLQFELGDDNQLLNHLFASVERMAHVVDQILKLNRSNPEQFSQQMQKVSLKKLVQQVIGQLYPEMINRHQTIEFNDGDIFIKGNDFFITTMLQNLITNASKYTPEGGHILVSTQQNQGQSILMVEDSGPGINENERGKVFDRFYRIGGDCHNSNVIGCGLGLAIVKHIAQLHRASIQLDKSQKLNGLKISVVFPQLTSKNEELLG